MLAFKSYFEIPSNEKTIAKRRLFVWIVSTVNMPYFGGLRQVNLSLDECMNAILFRGCFIIIIIFFSFLTCHLGANLLLQLVSKQLPTYRSSRVTRGVPLLPIFACSCSTLFTDLQFTKEPSTNLFFARLSKQQAVGDLEVVALQSFDLL